MSICGVPQGRTAAAAFHMSRRKKTGPLPQGSEWSVEAIVAYDREALGRRVVQ